MNVYHRIHKNVFDDMYFNYILGHIYGCGDVGNPMHDNLCLTRGNDVIDIDGNVIGTLVD